MLDLERPFHRLIHHFIVRIFHGAGEGDDLQFSIPAMLGLLAAPSAAGALQLMGKYSTLRHFFLGIRNFDVYRASMPDEYFFVVYSMVVTGFVVILKWDRLFPDRQDYDNLAVLPLSTRQNFMASLIALLFLAALFAVVTNGAACVLFPTAVTAQFNSFSIFVDFFVAHTVAVVLASFFSCFGLLLLMGVTILLTPKRFRRAFSLGVRILCALGLIGIMSTALTMPRLLWTGDISWYTLYVPSVWFLDLNQMLLSKGTQTLGAGLASLQITAVTVVLALIVYAVTYYREYIRIPESSGLELIARRDSHSLLRRAIDRIYLRSPFQRATYYFAIKTLFRSEQHCLLFGTAAAMGFFLAAQTVSDVITNPAARGIDPRILSVALTLAYFAVVTLRALFDLPSDRKANWIFRATVDVHEADGRGVAAKVMLSTVAPWLFLIGIPVHVALWGWTTALLHTGYVLMCSFALAELLLIRFQKIPFSCLYTASKDKVLVRIVLGLFGWSLFSEANASLEATLLRDPIHFLVVLPFFVVGIWWIRFYRQGLPQSERILIFEDRPAPAVQVLNLTK